MADRDAPRDGTTRIVRNVLALVVSSGLMAAVGFPIMAVEYDSGTAALAGTVLLLLGLAVAVGLTFALLDPLERVAGALVAAWRGRRPG